MMVFVYGPGGPYPAVNYSAFVFNKIYKTCNIIVKAGPTKSWIKKAKENADIIYSGSENMMEDFESKLDNIDKKSIYPLYQRPSVVIVRNDSDIHSFDDLLKPGVNIMVVNGAGQIGLWEDMFGKYGNLKDLRIFQKNIVYTAKNSKEAINYWKTHKNIEAFLIYNIWGISHPHIGKMISTGKFTIYRDMDIALTKEGESNSCAKKFYSFLKSKEGYDIFKRYGWSK